ALLRRMAYDGRGSTKCGSTASPTMAVTSTLSPPTSSASDLNVSTVVTTRTLASARAAMPRNAATNSRMRFIVPPNVAAKNNGRRETGNRKREIPDRFRFPVARYPSPVCFFLERMRSVRPDGPLELQKHRIVAGAPVEVCVVRPGDADARELGRQERDRGRQHRLALERRLRVADEIEA